MLYHGNYEEVLPRLHRKFDLVLSDPPYAITKNNWDKELDLDKFWSLIKNSLTPNGVVVLCASQPFSSKLVLSNLEWFRHEWVWIKNRGSNFANTSREPMKEHESVLIFAPNKWTFNKQMQERAGAGADRVKYKFNFDTKSTNYNTFKGSKDQALPELRVPSSWQKFNCEVGLHPTQKPLSLMEYLIKTYSNEEDSILDPFAGSGTTLLAAQNLNRIWTGVELELQYFNKASVRLGAIKTIC